MNATTIATLVRTKTLSLLESERRALARIAAGYALAEVLEELIRALEAQSDVEMLGSILILDEDRKHLLLGVAPSLPKTYSEAIHGAQIGPAVGSCGTAAFRGEPVFVPDIANDPLWVDYRDLALAHGLRACWSTPIKAADGRVLGTFAFYYREPRSPSQQDLESIALVSRTVAFAMERDRAQQALRESRERLSYALKAAGVAGTWDWRIAADRLHFDARLAALLSLAPKIGEEGAALADLLAAIHPEDVGHVQAAIDHTLATGERLFQEFRWTQKDGSVRWVIARGECHYDGKGKPLRLAGAVVDVTPRKQAEEALRQQSQRLETFDRVSQSISGDLDLESIVQTVTDIATELTSARFGAFFYNALDEQGEQFLLYTLSGAPRAAFAQFSPPRNTAVFEPTFRGAGVVRSDDIRADPRYGKSGPHYGMPKSHLPVVSYLAVPVVSRSGQVHGGLFFGHDRPAVFTKESEEIVKGIAAHAANAIDNARLLEEARAEIAERRRAEERQRQRAEAALKESEARLQEALTAGRVMAFEWDRATRLSQRSKNAAEILGFDGNEEGRGTEKQFLDRVHPDDRAHLRAHVYGLRPDNRSYAINFRYIRPDGREVWLEETAKGEFDASGRYLRLKGLTRDITERKRAEEHQTLLTAELDHRVKNVLACVAAIAQRTRENSGSIDEFLTGLDGRIRSMANAHALLSRGRWQGASLGDIVGNELAPWAGKSNVIVEGPRVFLEVEATQTLAMVLHELATNAAKYGALSNGHGRISVRWQRRSDDKSSAPLLLEWQEKGGPPVATAPTTQGYGTSVIRDLIPYELGGSVDLEFSPEGVLCRIEIPASWVDGALAWPDSLPKFGRFP
jgi:PAS domain S-box-containing protein